MGFTRCIMPAANIDRKDPGFAGTACALVGVKTVQEGLEHLLA